MYKEETKQKKKMYQAQIHLSKNLRLLRAINGLRQSEVATELHMSRSSYCHLESGAMTPDFVTIVGISEYYNVSLDYLLSFDITEHFMSILERDKRDTDACLFIKKYLQLSYGARKQVRERIAKLAAEEEKHNLFPWKYEDIEYKGDQK